MAIRFLDESPSTGKIRFLDEDQQPTVHGVFGDVQADRYALGERNIAGNLIERPAAAARGAIRGNPLLAFLGPLAGVTALSGVGGQSAKARATTASLNPATERPFQTEAIDRYYQGVAQRQPGKDPTLAQTVGGMVPSAVGMAADVVTSPVDALLTVLGLTPQARHAATAISESRPGQAVEQVLTKSRRTPIEILRGRLKPISETKLPTLTEAEVARLPQAERTAYFQARANEATIARQQRAFQLKQQGQQAIQQLQQAKVQAERQLPSVAHQSIQKAEAKLNQTLLDQSTEYRNRYHAALAKSETVKPFTSDEVLSSIYDEFIDDPITYKRMELLLNTKPFFKEAAEKSVPISPRQLASIADDLSGSVGRAARQKQRAYTPDEMIADKLRHSILNLIEKRGVPVRDAKDFWREWVPQRDLALKLQTPSGPRTLIQITKGQDPVRAQHLSQLEALMEEKLDTQTRQVFNQLDAIAQQKVLVQAKQAEQQFLLSQQTGASKGSDIFKKMRVEQQARRNRIIRRAIYGGLALLAAKTTPGKAILSTGRDLLFPQMTQ